MREIIRNKFGREWAQVLFKGLGFKEGLSYLVARSIVFQCCVVREERGQVSHSHGAPAPAASGSDSSVYSPSFLAIVLS